MMKIPTWDASSKSMETDCLSKRTVCFIASCGNNKIFYLARLYLRQMCYFYPIKFGIYIYTGTFTQGEINLATYVTSDLHGYPLKDFKAYLDKVGFSDEDFLYILDDVIDRNGDGGVEMLCWLLEQQNMQLIKWNHEAMLLSCTFIFDEITTESIDNLTCEKMSLLSTYMHSGGNITLKSLQRLNRSSTEKVNAILNYFRKAPLYKLVTAGEKDYLLVHGGLGNFKKIRVCHSTPRRNFYGTVLSLRMHILTIP